MQGFYRDYILPYYAVILPIRVRQRKESQNETEGAYTLCMISARSRCMSGRNLRGAGLDRKRLTGRLH